MTNKQEIRQRAVVALTGTVVEVGDPFDGHDEKLTAKGANNVLNALKLADITLGSVE